MCEKKNMLDSRFSADSIRSAGNVSAEYRIEVYPLLASTNETVRALATQGAPSGTVIFADRQTAGRGRMGRSFFSPGGSGIYMTLLLRPKVSPDRAISVTTFAAVAAARAIEAISGISASVKWVNDIWLNGRKVCGILAEAALDPSGQALSHIALGIGINVNQTEFPPELSEIATSIACELGSPVDRSRLSALLLHELEPLLAGGEPIEHLEEYRRRNLVLGRKITVVSGGESYSAIAKKIEDNGNLIVETEDGTEKCVFAGEVSLRL